MKFRYGKSILVSTGQFENVRLTEEEEVEIFGRSKDDDEEGGFISEEAQRAEVRDRVNKSLLNQVYAIKFGEVDAKAMERDRRREGAKAAIAKKYGLE